MNSLGVSHAGLGPVPILALKLNHFTRLSADDVDALQRITRNFRTIEPRGVTIVDPYSKPVHPKLAALQSGS
jgi:hypothetical protein